MAVTYQGFSTSDARIARNGLATIEEIIDPDLLVPNLDADTKIGAIKELVDRLHAKGVVEDSLSFLQSVLEREALHSTILHDVALPHARSLAVNQMGMALGIARRPIDFPSGDERGSIQLICLIAVPARASHQYISLLGTLARTFTNIEFKNALLHCASSQDLYHLLSSHTVS